MEEGDTIMPRMAWKRPVVLALVATTASSNVLAGACGFRPAFTRPDENGTATVTVFRGDPVPALGNVRPLLFISSLKVNTDGTKISYHQDDVTGRRCQTNPAAKPCAINNIRNAFRDHTRPESDFITVRNAGYPNPQTWNVLSPEIIEKRAKTGKPCVTADGYLVSMTADVAVNGGFARVGDCDQAKWIDALTVPALVLPKATTSIPSEFVTLGMRKRSVVVAASSSSTKRVVAGVVGDFGPAKELGEATPAMNGALNGLAATDLPKHRQDAIDRFQAQRAAVLLLPGSGFVLARPIDAPRVADAGREALAKFGGAEKLYGCIKDEVDAAF